MTSTNASARALSPSPSAAVERCYATAHAALERDDLDGARRFFSLLAVVAPHDERAWIGLGLTEERADRFAMAAAMYQLGTTFARGSALCHFGRARACRRLGRAALASEALEHAAAATDDASLLAAIEHERAAA